MGLDMKIKELLSIPFLIPVVIGAMILATIGDWMGWDDTTE